jgi:hypothetical protein
MRIFILSMLLLATHSIIHAQDFDGYYIQKSGDTIRGKVQVPKGNLRFINATNETMGSVTGKDRLGAQTLDESKKIDYSKLTFDIKFSENDGKPKKIDRLTVKGFGFIYENRPYDFITWDIKANKQIFITTALGDVDPNGVYFILRSINAAWTIYSLFQSFQVYNKSWNNSSAPGVSAIKKDFDGAATKRDIIFEHPTKGLLYISNQYPLKMKFAETLKFLELEEEFIQTLDKKDNILDVVLKYNSWKQK